MLNRLAEERLKQAHGEIEAGSAEQVEARMAPHEAHDASAPNVPAAR